MPEHNQLQNFFDPRRDAELVKTQLLCNVTNLRTHVEYLLYKKKLIKEVIYQQPFLPKWLI
jgi:plasmid rolling circle replication initiator protein Rep